MTLSPQREKFCQGIADGLSQAESLRAAYPKSKNWKPEAVWSEASRLLANHKVSARVAEIRAELAEKQLWKREDSVKALKGVIEHPDKASDIVVAVKELNAMHGYNEPQKIAMTNPDGTPAVQMPTIIQIVDLAHDDSTDSDTA